ncbi:MAG: alkaline phosphatase [Ruminococcaceae bacterium]|nr:alkaline phosphatase [Oscillospiraceae bacterium]
MWYNKKQGGMTMKRLLTFFSIIILALVLFSCGNAEIDDFQIVIPENADLSTKYAAENLASMLSERGDGVEIVTDSAREAKFEILIGDTNREESKTVSELSNGQYLLFARDSKIVIKGYGIYVGAGAHALVNEYDLKISDLPTEESPKNFVFPEKYDSVIFMIGDGMGENHIKMAEKNGMPTFIARSFIATGKSITRSQSVIDKTADATDSAASGTAMATGYKTLNSYVGLDANGNPVQNVRELAFSLGAKTAVVTTDKITGATPSSYMCHNISRENTEELQAEIDALSASGKIDYVAGSVDNNLTGEVRKALSTISKDSSQFFIMIEEGHIDKRAHEKDNEGAVEMVKRFNDAVAYATQFTLCHPDTLLIVTADHETGKLTASKYNEYGYLFHSYNHTNEDVPFFMLGAGASAYDGQTLENIELAKICASAYTTEPFGME